MELMVCHPPHRRRGARDRRHRSGAGRQRGGGARRRWPCSRPARSLDRAKLAVPYVPGTLADLYAGAHAAYPDDHRYSADNMWTHAPVEDLLPGLRAHRRDDAPRALAHALDELGPRRRARPDAPGHGLQRRGRHLHRPLRRLAGPGRRRADVAWATERMREMEPLATGIQLADENLGCRPARFLSDENLRSPGARARQVRPRGALPPVDGAPVSATSTSAPERQSRRRARECDWREAASRP